jgi:genome maintenance exonuclease 1
MNIIDLDKVEIPGAGRFYRSPTTKLWYPSITTVTGHAKAQFFNEWRKKPGNDKVLSQAAKTGTAVHSIIEKYLNKEEIVDSKKFTLMDKLLFHQIKPEIDKITDIVLQEKSLFSDLAKVAGRVDCIGMYDGKLSVIDFKTSRKQKKAEWISNYFQQATGYAIMYEEMTGQKIDDIVILMTCDDGEIQVFKEKTKDHVEPLFQTIKSYWSSRSFRKLQESINEGN